MAERDFFESYRVLVAGWHLFLGAGVMYLAVSDPADFATVHSVRTVLGVVALVLQVAALSAAAV